MAEFKPKAYVKTTCPYSFKFRLFVTEAGLAERFEFVAMDPFSGGFKVAKEDLAARSGAVIRFPVVEVEPDVFMTDSDALIAHFAGRYGIDEAELSALAFYRCGLFPTILELIELCSGPLPWLIRLGKVPRAFR